MLPSLELYRTVDHKDIEAFIEERVGLFEGAASCE